MKRMLTAALALLIAASPFFAAAAEAGYAQATYFDDYYDHVTPAGAGWVRIRAGADICCQPDPDAPVMEAAYSGREYEYMNQTQYDSRGTAWYCIYCYGYLGWVSSRNATIQWPKG